MLDVSDYDLIISDYEPVTAWAAKLHKKPCIGIAHQYAFNGASVPMPKETKQFKNLITKFAPATYELGMHWYPYGEQVFPPIIDTSLVRKRCKGHVLVYLPFSDSSHFIDEASLLDEQQFIMIATDRPPGVYGNVEVKRPSHDQFKIDLMTASGVICSTGFELISECIHLGIPALTTPIVGQVEQQSNALSLNQLKMATVCEYVDSIAIAQWLEKLHLAQAKPWPDTAQYLADWIVKGDLNTPVNANNLWANH